MKFQNIILMFWLICVIVAMLVAGGTSSRVNAQVVPRPIDELIFKGTHNSYSCEGKRSVSHLTNSESRQPLPLQWFSQIQSCPT